jgi:hypothetical protein
MLAGALDLNDGETLPEGEDNFSRHQLGRTILNGVGTKDYAEANR